jgi:hypothetical protein
LFERAGVAFGQEETMNDLEVETENAHRRQALLEEAQVARSLEQAGMNHTRYPLRALLLAAGALIALGMRIKDWGETVVSQGYLPNLHID